MAPDDSLQARVSPDCPSPTRDILYHAWAHDLSGLKPFLNSPGNASLQDPTTGETPLHAAIRSCGPAEPKDAADDGDEEEEGCVQEAVETIRELLFSGAIWNDVDDNNETPGCVASRLGRQSLYNLCVEAGVRAEMLFGLMGGYEELSSAGSEQDAEEGAVEIIDIATTAEATANGADDDEAVPDLVVVPETEPAPQAEKKFQPPQSAADKDVNSEDYLRSALTYSEGKLVDDDGNGVMMAWETDIMRRSVDALLPSLPSGKRILNIGFGMGIIDEMFASTNPAKHHIVEAHPGVLAHLSQPDSKFGAKWEASGPVEGAFKVHKGRWQDVLPGLLAEGELYDAIYFDTFGEDYSQLRSFFTEYVPGMLEFGGRFGFFNGLGADRRISYDIYTKVVEMHLSEVGLDVDWDNVSVDMQGMEEAGKGEWEGVRRRYWTLNTYRLPTCSFMG